MTTAAKKRPIPGYRTMTAAQRYNARMERLWDECKDVQTRFNASSRTEDYDSQTQVPATTQECENCHFTIKHAVGCPVGYEERFASTRNQEPASKQQHTATPWRVGRGSRIEQARPDAGEFESRRIIADMTHSDRAEADARFIVKAVNSHDRLVALAKAIPEFVKTLPQTYLETEKQNRRALLEMARAALAEVQEK